MTLVTGGGSRGVNDTRILDRALQILANAENILFKNFITFWKNLEEILEKLGVWIPYSLLGYITRL